MNIFKIYIDYLKDNPQGYWFKRKLYGWGWTPATKKGWLVVLVYITCILFFASLITDHLSMKEALFTIILPLAVLAIVFVKILYTKGEKPKWQWGIKKDSSIGEK